MADDGFVATLVTVRLPDGHGELDVKLRSMPIPRDLGEILDLPLSRLAIKHGPRHWLMDRIAIDDTGAVLVCRECYERVEIPARAKNLYELLMFWHRHPGPTYYKLHFRADHLEFGRYLSQRYPSPYQQQLAREALQEADSEARAMERASAEGMPEPPQ